MSKFIPDYIFKKVSDIDVSLLKEKNIKLMLLDIDNTLAEHNSFYIEKETIVWLKTVIKSNITVILFSNNTTKRVSGFCEKINSYGFNFDHIYSAKKPLTIEYKKAIKNYNINKKNIMGVGDQIFTDVLGANLFGIVSVLVEPINKDFNLLIKFKRNFEGIFVKQYYKRLGKNNGN